MFDWQTIAVAFVIAGALLYVGRRALARLRSFRVSRGGGSCATGCGGCGETKQETRPATRVVQITPSKNPSRRASR